MTARDNIAASRNFVQMHKLASVNGKRATHAG